MVKLFLPIIKCSKYPKAYIRAKTSASMPETIPFSLNFPELYLHNFSDDLGACLLSFLYRVAPYPSMDSSVSIIK